LEARTVNVYEVPFARPVTVSGELAPVAKKAPGLEVAAYELIAAPPSLEGAVKEIVACASPAVALPIAGAPGTETPYPVNTNERLGLSAKSEAIVRFPPRAPVPAGENDTPIMHEVLENSEGLAFPAAAMLEIVIVEAVRFLSATGIADELEPCTCVLNVNPASSDCRLSPPEDELVPTEAGDPNVPRGVRENSGS